MDQATKTAHVLRHGSEMTIPEAHFNPATDTRLDPQTPASDDPSAAVGEDASHMASSKASDRSKRG